MDETNWLQSRITVNEELLWKARQFWQGLLEYRADIGPLWDDSAARHVRARFLSPHEEDADRLLMCLSLQTNKLSEAMAELKQVYLSAAEADRLSAEISRLLEESSRATHSASATVETALAATSQSFASSAEAENLAARADAFGA